MECIRTDTSIHETATSNIHGSTTGSTTCQSTPSLSDCQMRSAKDVGKGSKSYPNLAR